MGYRKLKRLVIAGFIIGLIIMAILLAAILQPEINNYEDIVYKIIGGIGIGIIALIFYFLKSLFKKGFLSENKKLTVEEDVVKEQLNNVDNYNYRPTPTLIAKEKVKESERDKENREITVKVQEEENNGYTSQYEY